MRPGILLFLILFVIGSCDSDRVFEENTDLGEYWAKEAVISFAFSIEDSLADYNLYTNIRNASSYPFHNLYYQYSLSDSSGRELSSELKNLTLFDPKTGEPYGSGLGDLFDHRQLILENFNFPTVGTYTLTFEQYMRMDTLPMILSVGARVEAANP